MTLLRDLLEYTLAHRQILAILGLTIGTAGLLSLIVFKSRIIIQNRPGSKTAWVLLIEMAVYNIVLGTLHGLSLYGVDTTIAFGLAGWLFFFAALATIVALLINMSRGSGRG